jgi:protein phosphatase
MNLVSIPEAVTISFAGQCDRGKVRKENQDSVLQTVVPLGDLLVVADGIGGYEGGGVASRMAVEVLSASLAGMPTFFPPALAIQEAACRANTEIVAAAAEPGTPNNRMGTTVVLALLQPDPNHPETPVQAWIGHIGDSRAYLVHLRRLSRITRDHSVIQLLIDRELIVPEHARQHPDASVLTRSLGHEPNVEIELDSVSLAPGDTLLLCSDGLWGYVADREIERVLGDSTLSVEEASRALLKLALDAGGHDNVGIQIARLAGSSDTAAFADRKETFASPPPVNTAQAPEIASAKAPGEESAQESESTPKSTIEPEFDYVPKFDSAELPGSSLVKMLIILFATFALSGALVYSALLQNWLGMDRFVR